MLLIVWLTAFSYSKKEKKCQIINLKKYWFNYSIINLLNIDKNDFSNKNYDAKQSINLNNYFILDYLYMFASMQLEVKSDFENVH